MSHVDVRRKNIPERGTNRYKGPLMGTCLAESIDVIKKVVWLKDREGESRSR